MNDYTGWSINTGFLDGNIIPNDGYKYDQDELVEYFAEALFVALTSAFPGAGVTVCHHNAEGSLPHDCQTSAEHPDTEDLDRHAEADAIMARVDDIQGNVFEAIDWDKFELDS